MVFKFTLKKLRLLGAVCAGILSLTALPSFASVVYQYTGNTYNSVLTGNIYNKTMSVTGFLELADPLSPDSTSAVTPISFGFGDGATIITNSDASDSFFQFTTNAAGNIIDWHVLVATDYPEATQLGDTRTTITAAVGSDSATVVECSVISTATIGGDPGACVMHALIDVAWNSASGEWVAPPIPVPAAVWLFGSGLLGLIGVAKRKVRV